MVVTFVMSFTSLFGSSSDTRSNRSLISSAAFILAVSIQFSSKAFLNFFNIFCLASSSSKKHILFSYERERERVLIFYVCTFCAWKETQVQERRARKTRESTEERSSEDSERVPNLFCNLTVIFNNVPRRSHETIVEFLYHLRGLCHFRVILSTLLEISIQVIEFLLSVCEFLQPAPKLTPFNELMHISKSKL